MARTQLGVDVTHPREDEFHHMHERWLAQSEQPGVSHRATQNASQDVPSAFVTREHSIGEQKRYRAGMVGDHAIARAFGAFEVVRTRHQLSHFREGRREEVRVEVV